jgi:predicted lipoprotein
MRTTTRRLSPIRPWMITLAVTIVVLVIAAFNVKVVSLDDAAASAGDTFDPATFAEEHYASEIVPQIEKDATDLATLVTALDGGADEADYGNTSGAASAFAFPVTFTAVAGELKAPILALDVEGIPDDITVQLQAGPAVSGTALRDVTGTIDFNNFTNQLEYQNVATELNNQAKAAVLADLDAASLKGKTLTITGAYLRVNPKLISVVPVKIEVAP